MHHPVQLLVFTVLCLWTLPLPAMPEAIAPADPQPLRAILAGTPVADIADDVPVQLPVLKRGGDVATILANGGQAQTQEGSLFSNAKLDFQLVYEEHFPSQLRSYLAGKSPYLRGTAGMINMAAEALSQEPRTKPVVIYQMSWSSGDIALVVKPGITSVRSLQGKTIALQRHSPHAAFLARLLEDADLGGNDITLSWVSNSSDNDSTAALFRHDDVDAAFVASADAMKLTTAGNASGELTPPARILLSTRTASRVVTDLYAVRSDYLKSHRKEVQQFVHALLKASEALQTLAAAGEGSGYAQLLSNAARLMRTGEDANTHVNADIEHLLAGSELAGWQGNVNLFEGSSLPGSLNHISTGIQSAFIAMGLLDTKIPLADAGWDYAQLREGLGLDGEASAQRFDPQVVALSAARKQRRETLNEGELFSVELFFEPNQQGFPDDSYQDAFNRVVDYLSTYPGALVTIEGHSDPLGYLRSKSSGVDSQLLGRIKQAARNSSLSHAAIVRDSIIGFALAHGVSLDPGRIAILGQGISRPKNGVCSALPCMPATEQEWRDNMRVKVRILQVEAEQDLFHPRMNSL